MKDLSQFGEHFVVGLAGTSLSELDKEILETLRPRGVLLLKRNFDHTAPYDSWLKSLEGLYSDIKKRTGRSDLIISIDHEGDRVTRTPSPITHFPAAMFYSGRAAEVGHAMGVELKSIGVNVSWAPVADIHSNPSNPVIGKRAFDTEATSVSSKVSEFAEALMKTGVLGCAKHFPGHGDTAVDSHLELPVVERTLDEIRVRELLPFQALIKKGIPFVMTSHILFPKIDSENPATLSYKLLTGVLREELGFDGVVVSDDLDMKAISSRLDASETIARAMSAGCDLFIVARHPNAESKRPLELAENLRRSLEKKRLDPKVVDAARSRIQNLCQKRLKQHNVNSLATEILVSNAHLAEEIRARC